MDFLTRDDLRALVSHSGRPCVSIYLPTHRSGTETQQDPIRLKNLLRDADQNLRAQATPAHEITALLARAHELRENFDFWQHQSDGLAIFIAANLFRTYRVQLKVPELAVVADRFHVKPLLAAITSNSHFYVLALSQNRTRLFRGTQASLIELEIADMPGGMPGAADEESAGRQLQSHSAGAGHGGRSQAIFHGASERDRKEELLAYFRGVDEVVHRQVGTDPGPLILASVNYHYPLYRKVNSSPVLLEDWISGNPDTMSAHDLFKQAIAIELTHASRAQKEASDQYLALWHTQRASNKLSDVLPAALQGRVASLLVAVGVQKWGRLDATTNEARISGIPGEGDEDLLNVAAIHTYITGGAVHAVPPEQVPGGGDVAAVFRY